LNRTVTISISAIVACVLGVAFLSYSPAGCSCTDKWEELAYYAGLPAGLAGPQALDATSLQAGLRRNLVGSTASFGSSPFSEREGCLRPRDDLIRCNSVLEESPFFTRGYDIDYRLGAHDTISDIVVRKFTKVAIAP
jgi:hypothetical protein